MTPSSQSGATSVAARRRATSGSSITVESLMTRDIPLPPRSLRVGLGTGPLPAAGSGKTAGTQLPPIEVKAAQTEAAPAAPAPAESGPLGRSSDAPLVEPAPATGFAITRPSSESTRTDRPEPSAQTRVTADIPVTPPPAGPKRARHRSGPPAALKARSALIAVAAGAAAAAVAGSGTTSDTASTPSSPPPAAPGAPALAAAASDHTGGGVVPAVSGPDMSDYAKQLNVGKQLAASAAAAEAAKRKPLFAAPILAKYSFTSGFGPRWGSMHGGLDLAAPLGTPIHAVADGVVKKAGPASGYGNWIQIKHADGTITMYGHMAASGVLVEEGQKVTAGDVIGLVGSEGFSTGPHLHLEVWKNGTTKIDPAPWLAKNGIRINAYGN
ncbi:M23 family metallopeptidase [Gordonia iterans]